MLRTEQKSRPAYLPIPDTWVVVSDTARCNNASTEEQQSLLSLDSEPNTLPEQEQTYPTGFGNLTFSELYAATDRIVGYTLRQQYGMSNPDDIDDCMQAGYFNVWQRLQKQPEWFAGKPKKYVVQAVVMRSKAQRYAHLRHYRKIVYDADAHCSRNVTAPTTSQLDTWIDLEQAVQTVGHYTARLDNPIYVWALYALLTEVKTQDVAKLFGRGVSSFTAAKRQVRCTLAHELPGYGNELHASYALSIPKQHRIKPFNARRELTVSQLLFDESPRKPVRHSNTFVFQSRILTEQPAFFEVQQLPSEPTYQTQWRGGVTFEELITDQQVKKVAFAKARSLGHTDQDAEDCFQLGSIKLWQALTEQPMLLCDKGAAWVGVWIAFSGSRRALWKHKARSVPLDRPYQRGNRPERWAGFATRVDERIDFELLMNALAQRYDGDPLKLFALYSLTTSVKMKDVLSVAKVQKNHMVEARSAVKADMRAFLEREAENDIAEEFWTDQLNRGENLECVTRVAERVMDNQRLLLALYIVTTSAKRKDVTTLFGIGITAFRKEITQIKAMLAEEFRKAKRR